jgi:VWFA-related protein
VKSRLLLSFLLSFTLLLSTFARPLASSTIHQSEKSKAATGANQDDKKKEQAQTSPPEEVVKLGVTLVQVDAVVTDKDDKYVTDLKADDFEIYEDGRKQQITNFSFVPVGAKMVARTESAKPVDKNAVSLPPVPLRPEQVQRTITLVVDDLRTSFESNDRVRQALKKFVDEQMQPGDLVAIVRTGAGTGTLQQFTSDKRRLYAAIERVRYNLFSDLLEDSQSRVGDERNRGATSLEQTIKGGGNDIAQFRDDIFTIGTLGTLNTVVRGLRDLPGRKSVILFSDGISLLGGSDNVRRLESMRRLIDLANRAAVVIYTIDAKGLVIPGATAADNFNGLSPSQINQRLNARDEQSIRLQDGLSYLAAQTGGLFTRNANDLSRGVSRALEDQQGYYLIGYIPSEATFKSVGGRYAYHKLTIKVKSRNLKVRSRTEFLGIADTETNPTTETPTRQLVSAITSPFASGAIPLQLTSLFGYDEKVGHFTRSLLYIDTRKLSFTQGENGARKAVIDIAAVTYQADSLPIDKFWRRYEINISEVNFERFNKQGLIYMITLPLKKPGAYQLRLAVRDDKSELVGAANQFIDVPDVKKGRLTISGITAQGINPDKAAADQAVQLQEGAQELTKDDPQSGPALRRITSKMELSYGFFIYNAKLDDKTHAPQLETQVILLKEGKAIYQGKSTPLDVDAGQDMKQILTGGQLNFNSLDPGEYVLQIVVTDKLAKDKNRTATQWVDFEIVK